ncbi:MAG TPA: MFS transporter [Ktedonobacteraceae bacterium]
MQDSSSEAVSERSAAVPRFGALLKEGQSALLAAPTGVTRVAAPGARLWRNRNFNVFWAGQTLSVLGDAFAAIAIPLLVLQATGSVALMGLVTAVFGLSQVVMGPFAGWLADRLDRRRVMIFCDVGRTLLYFSIPLGWWLAGPQLWLIFAVVALGSALGMVFQVTYITAISNLVDPDQLSDANSRLQGAQAIAFILGPILAGLISGAFGPSVAIIVDSLSFAASAVSILLIRLRPVAQIAPQDLLRADTPLPESETRARGGLKQEFLAGLHFLWQQPVLRSLTVLLFLNGLLSAGALDIFIFYIKHDLGQSDSVVGLVFGLASIGGVVAGVLTPRLRRNLGFAVCWLAGTILEFSSLSLIGVSVNLLLIGLLATVFTFTSTLTAICSISLRQQITPDYLLGRVTSAFWTLTSSPAPLGAALFTALAGHSGAAIVLGIIGVGGALISAAGFFTPIRQQRA